MNAASPAIVERRPAGELIRWSASAVAVLAVYALAAILLSTWRVLPLRVDELPPAVMLDLAPVPKAPAPAPPAPPVVQPRQEITQPPLPVPIPPRPRVEPPKPRVQHRPLPPPEPAMPAPPVSTAPAPPVPSPAPAPAQAPQISPQMKASFQAALLAHLERFKRYPRAALMRRDQGTAALRFVIDRAGHVLAASLERSSGHESLDDEVVAMIKRADPLPPIPPELPDSRLEFVVPIQFKLR
jgi:protein TonB